ncbi:MAG: 2Fe-2S iron-sulfur cluster-binding protein [Bacteroidia bacterium]
MAKFYKLKISDVRKETADCVSVAFEIPVSLKEEYKFIQGQYLTLKLFVKGEEVRRSYSISSGVHENELRVAVKRVKDGKGSNFIYDNFKIGQEAEVMTPMGGFHSPMNPYHKKNYVLFAGGSGITPMCSIIKTVLKDEPNSSLQLFYGNLDEEATIFRDQLNKLAQNNSSRLNIYYILDKPKNSIDEIFTGMLSAEKVKQLVQKFVDLNRDNEFFICGPGVMMDNVKKVLDELSVEKNRIHIEYFTSSSIDAPGKIVPASEKITAEVTVSQYGIETTFTLDSTGKAILDAAIDHGVDAPFACKGAVCATCRGKVLEGKVHMDKNFALTDAEVAEGFILTCQSHPITPVVKVDYDV